MAFNLGRPALFAGEETILHCRAFLAHPLGIQTDSRLVATCELLTARREKIFYFLFMASDRKFTCPFLHH